jgi:hypothetical protein
MSRVNKLKQKSANILSVFSKTVINLENLNKEVIKEQIARGKAEQALKEAAMVERKAGADLQVQFDANKKVADKIKAFLND